MKQKMTRLRFCQDNSLARAASAPLALDNPCVSHEFPSSGANSSSPRSIKVHAQSNKAAVWSNKKDS
ncbi:hypothetical protein V2J09_005968 [Rumex salicifolius]